MAELAQAKLADHIDLLVGFAFKGTDFTDEPTEPRLVRVTNIGPGNLKWDQVERFPGDRIEEVDKYMLEPGDVVLAMDGPWRPSGLKWARVGETDLPLLLVQRVARLRGTPTLTTDYLRCLVDSPGFAAYIRSVARGTTVSHISATEIGEYCFELPGVSSQSLVASVVCLLDDLNENNKRRIKLLEESARLLYQKWFVHFRYPGHEDVALVDSELGPIPMDFKVKNLNEVCEINRKSVRQGELSGEILYVDISSVGQRTMDPPEPINFNDAPGRARRVVRDGDTIWSTVRPNRRSHVLLIDPPGNLICSTGFAVLSPTTVPSSFLHELSSHESFTAHLEGRATGSAYPAVRPEDFECYRFALPNPTLLQAFDELAGSLHQLQAKLGQENEMLKRTRDLLLPRLVSGDLDISDLDLDLETVV